MPQEVFNYGLGGIIAIYVIKELFVFIKSLVNGKSTPTCTTENCLLVKKADNLLVRMEDVQDMCKRLDDLHSTYDEDGSPKWFIKKQLGEDAHTAAEASKETLREMKTLSETIKAVMTEVSEHLKTFNSLLQKVIDA